MATVRKNIVLEGVSGTLGDQLVFRIGKGGQTIISTKPKYPDNRQFSDAQQAHMQEFKEAVAYAKDAAKNQPIYADKAEGTSLNAFNVATADFMHPPEIDDVDVSGYSGKVGETIRAQVVDDVKVDKVTVVIANEQNVLIEQGAAVADGGLWWKYVTTVNANGANVKVVVHAWDLPGNEVTKQG
jgi:hypothetical protein